MSREETPEQTVLPDGLNRRAFCVSALAAGVAMACGGGGGGSVPVTATPPAGGLQTTTDTKAVLLASPDGTARDYRNLGFFLFKDATGLYAMTTICTHQGCTVGLPVGSLITCPCHGSQYSLVGGNLLGPATQPLVHFPVTEPSPGALLVVNTAQTVSVTTRLT